MAKFPSLGENTAVPDIMKKSPEAGIPLMQLHEAVMRGPGPLSEGERELIAAYVSKLNECSYCYGVHSRTAESYGFEMTAIEAMCDDLDSAPLDAKIKPLLSYIGKLTKRPASVTDADAKAVYDAGWDEQGLHAAIMVACTFNFMNRLLEGHGVHGHETLYRERGPMLKKYGYLPLIRLIDPARKKQSSLG